MEMELVLGYLLQKLIDQFVNFTFRAAVFG